MPTIGIISICVHMHFFLAVSQAYVKGVWVSVSRPEVADCCKLLVQSILLDTKQNNVLLTENI